MSYSNVLANRRQRTEAARLLDDNHAFIKGKLPDWLTKSTTDQRRSLGTSLTESHTYKTKLTDHLKGLQGIDEFARPLLQAALDQEFGPGLDVDKDLLVHVHLINASTLSNPRKENVTHQSLLQAALQNFELWEIHAHGFNAGSKIIRNNSRALKKAITPRVFASTCRRVDLGGQYQKHIRRYYWPKTADGQSDGQFGRHFTQSEQYELEALAHLALMKGDIDRSALDVLTNLEGSPQWKGGAVRCCSLEMLEMTVPKGKFENENLPSSDPLVVLYESIFNAKDSKKSHLKGVLLIESLAEADTRKRPCLVYFKGGRTPLKEYPSFSAFEDEIRDGLRLDSQYRERFAHYLDRRLQADFFVALQNRFSPYSLLAGRRIDAPDADLQLTRIEIKSPFKLLAYQLISKAVDDACMLAVPTDEEDKKSRLARAELISSWALNLMNVVAAFVPGLGQAMLVVFGAQLVSEIYHGIESWNEGDKAQALMAILGVIINLELIGIGAVAGHDFEGSQLLNDLDKVKLPNGEERLWKPDLSPYTHDDALFQDIEPDKNGVYELDGRKYVSLESGYYEIEPSAQSGEHRLRHPDNPQAFAPEVANNAKGAWHHWSERPMTWDKSKLFARLNPDAAKLPEHTAQRLLTISDTDESVLRRVHLDQRSPPALLEDTLLRFHLDEDIQRFIRRMDTGESSAVSRDELQMQLQLLSAEPAWPASKVLRILGDNDRVLSVYPKGGVGQNIDIHWQQIKNGDLLDTILDNLDHTEKKKLLGQDVESLSSLKLLRKKLAERAKLNRQQLFNSHYLYRTQTALPTTTLIKKQHPTLPTSAAQALMDNASVNELKHLESLKRLPLRLAEEARFYLEEMKITRAYEGIYLDSVFNPDSEKLTLHLLGRQPGWSKDIRIEVREASFNGKLLDAIGPEEAAPAQRKVLILEESLYETCDSIGQDLHGPDTLYAAVLHALPNAERKALGFPATGQGAQLKEALLKQSPLARDDVRSLLDLPGLEEGHRPPMRISRDHVGYETQKDSTRCPRETLGCRPAAMVTIMERLFPGAHWSDVEEFLALRGTSDLEATRALLKQYHDYNSTRVALLSWINRTDEVRLPGGRYVQFVYPADKQPLRSEVWRCWRRQPIEPGMRTAPVTSVGYTFDLTGSQVGSLPAITADFSHVESLALPSQLIEVTPQANTFLSRFPSLRWLDMSGNSMTSLPTSIGQMSELATLYLSNNRIVLTESTATQLESLIRLRVLDLRLNPIGQGLNVTNLRELNELNLNSTGITTWPTGVLELPELHTLDLRNNQLSTLPPELLLRTAAQNEGVLLDYNPFSQETLTQLAEYRQRTDSRLGLDPEPLGSGSDSENVGDTSDDSDWEDTPQASSKRAEPWLRDIPEAETEAKKQLFLDLEKEPEARSFFYVLKRMEGSADYKNELARPRLSAKVWRMIAAASDSQECREELFSLADQLPTCGDGYTIIFNDLGIAALAHEAGGQAEPLIKILRGQVRLKHVKDLSIKEVSRRQGIGLNPDDVEVELGYRIGLAKQLELPWEAESMLYPGISPVSPEEIADMYNAIKVLETQEHYWRDGFLTEKVWENWLRKRHAEEFSAIDSYHREKSGALDDLASADGDLSRVGVLSPEYEELKQQFEAAVANVMKLFSLKKHQIVVNSTVNDRFFIDHMDAVSKDRSAAEDRLLEKLTQQELDQRPAPPLPEFQP